MNIIFFGSDDFAQAHLDALINSDHNIVAVVTPPDKAHGRGMKTTAGPVKELAQRAGIKVLQPDNVNDESPRKVLKEFNADLFVVIAYGKILSKKILALPKLMPVNVHSSLLPKYRGAAPINWAVINGEKKSGISIIKMNEKMDAGDIVAQMEILIAKEDTSLTLRETMKDKGPAFLIETINRIEKGKFVLKRQEQASVTLAAKLDKRLAEINWQKSAEEIHNLIRGLQPWPKAQTLFKGKILKILASEVSSSHVSAPVGTVCEISQDGFFIVTGKGSLKIKKVHLQGAKAMEAKEFLRGHQLQKGFSFGK